MKITSKGQVTIPQALRERFGLLPDTEVEFIATANGLRLVKSSKPSNRGRALVERLRRRGTGKRSTDELLKLLRSEA
jgi:AbrB family looped-hinge helix DNA binding protein